MWTKKIAALLSWRLVSVRVSAKVLAKARDWSRNIFIHTLASRIPHLDLCIYSCVRMAHILKEMGSYAKKEGIVQELGFIDLYTLQLDAWEQRACAYTNVLL